MKPDNWNRFAAGLLAILLCLCSFSMPAFASGTDPAPEPLPEIIEEEPTTGGMEPEGDEKAANSIYESMVDFAKYAFNKSHAAAYAKISVQTAWLKNYYPVEFMHWRICA